MFIILLRFADKSAAPAHMEGHRAWLDDGFAAGCFIASGSLADGAGGAVLARGNDRAGIETRIAADPFVAAGVVEAEILGFDVSRFAHGLDMIENDGAR